MASQDETPTHRPTAGGEPSKDAPEMPETETGTVSANGTTLHGTSEHDAWDAEFSGLASGTAAGAGNATAASESDTADEPAPGGERAAADDGTGHGVDAGANREDTSADAGGSAGNASETVASETAAPETAASVTAPSETGPAEVPEGSTSAGAAPVESAGAGEADDSARATATSDSEATAADMTVPGGHPGVAQRSHLPMRRASTLPDLSRYASGPEDSLQDTDEPNAGTATAGAVSADRSPRTTGEKAGSRGAAAGTAAGATAVPGTSGTAASAPSVSADSSVDDPAADARASDAPATKASASGTDTRTAAFSTADVSAAGAHAADKDTAEKDTPEKDTESPDPADSRADEDSLSPAEAERRAREREKAAAGKPVLARVLQVMIAVFFPVMLLAAAIRAVATPLFLWVEYHRPGFPADSYGFTTDDRMTYGSYAVDYLLNWSGPRYLGDLVGDGGEPLYLESEVSHMADVKTVLTAAFVAALVMAVLSICAAFYLARRSPGGIRRALFAGAALTLVLVLVLLTLAILGWEQFFTQLHTVFFANGNWTFRLDDTLIRLFPAQFWMDAGIVIAALVLITCAVVLACCWPTKARRNRARAAREAARRRYTESLDAL